MPWSLAGETIHVDNDTDDQAEPIYGQIQILNATSTTLHHAGAKSYTRSIEFWCETDARWATLLAAANADANVNLTSDLGNQGNYRLLSVKGKRVHAVNRTNAWFRGTAELMKQ